MGYIKITFELPLLLMLVACTMQIQSGPMPTPQYEVRGTNTPDQPTKTIKPTWATSSATLTLTSSVSATGYAGCQDLHLVIVPETVAPVRKGPGTSYDILGKLAPNQALSILEISQNGEWLKIPFGNRIGWVFTGLALLTNELPDVPGATGQGMSSILESTPFDQVKNLAVIRSYTGQPELQLLFVRLEPSSNPGQQYALYVDCSGKLYWVELETFKVQE